MLGFLTLLVTFVTLLVFLFYKFSKERPENFPPGPPSLPIWGSYWFLLKENYNLLHLSFETLGKRYKTDILGFFLGNAPTVVTLSYELTKEMLSRDEFMGRNDTIIVQTRSRGSPKGIFFTDGPVWKQQRRFALRHMRDYGFGRRSENMENLAHQETNYLIDFLTKEPSQGDLDVCKKKGLVLVPDFMYGSLINTVMLVLTSRHFEHQEVRKYAKAAFRFMKSEDSTGGAITITPWLRYIAPTFFGFTSAVDDNDMLIDFMKGLIEEHVETFSDDHHRDFIDDYISESIKQGIEIDYLQLALITLDFMFPSPVGVGHTLSFYFAHLINNPEIQTKIQEEIDQVVGRSRLPSLDDRKDLPYFEASIRENLRLMPVTPLGVTRRCVKDTMLGGHFIPKDSFVLANLWTAHRDPRIWDDPEEFRPERFLDSDGKLLRKDYTIGFGAGKRLCAGETYARNTMFLIMSGLLQNFTFKSPYNRPIDLKDVLPGVTLSLKETWISAVPR
ncbi:cytochrome P450 304E1 [Tribolium castaneum]|uniref:Cytochrome P450 304E1 n=1 Tax=Tribolium castaneum TaxID=7070 RepID=D6WAF0_TRICA|nr:PREDICTED: probable cytochrome P450 304a1 [Tribolium castaneum]EEZ99196.1 cytochrome P450 304E1 [Tribolium castaneum]|eukprot:XP_973180.1 PREDICTED: probable cytochrome P450 304a1 [Tribolium castaneum]